ncbi:MAG TPA: hypothetical protein VMR73_02345 [Candidatus Paceibacterota bacterium]|nr:hypothetical protein [Candidatus Paceibacterota bacterium]
MSIFIHQENIKFEFPGGEEAFRVSDHFKLNQKSKKGTLPIDFLGTEFVQWFMDKVELPLVCPQRLWGHSFSRSVPDAHAVAELGEIRAEIFLREIYHFLMCADKYNDYVFHVRDTSGILRLVTVCWCNGWGIGADVIEDRLPWAIIHLRLSLAARTLQVTRGFLFACNL